MKLKNVIGHFKLITHHRWIVFKLCCKLGKPWRGFVHDLSKYSPTEFLEGVKYYTGDHSPITEAKRNKGYSEAWLHHRGRNKHHFEYWIDFSIKKDDGLVGHKMPLNYVIEMVMDRIAASRIYKGKDYTDRSAYFFLCDAAMLWKIHGPPVLLHWDCDFLGSNIHLSKILLDYIWTSHVKVLVYTVPP